jgi:hypothetical protein
MTKHLVIGSSTLLAAAVVAALVFLRPSPTGRDHLAATPRIPPAARAVLTHRMQRHGDEMRDLVTKVILLDDDAAARIGGEIYDEPTLARPLGGDELNGLLPERFFVLQDELRGQARRLVEAVARRDRAAVGDELGRLTRTCVACHEVYLHESPAGTPEATAR